MKTIAVNDTNVFIDLLDVGLLEEFFHLPWEIHTTDFVMYELLRDGQKDAVEHFAEQGLLHVASFEFDEIQEINLLHRQFEIRTNVSLTDCSVLYYAKLHRYTLLTGDRKLRSTAKREGIEVRGILYVFDELVAEGIISNSTACEKLSLLVELNPRLPHDEIQKRLLLWSNNAE